MAQPEVPVESVERTGQRTGAILGIIRTAPAIVRHLRNVTRGAAVRLASQEASVGVLAHADDVRQFDPLEGVNVDAEIPAFDLRGIHAGGQAERADDHEALNMMRISRLERLPDGVPHAVHLHLAGPEPRRQRERVPEAIGFRVARHLGPIDPPDILSPADDLPHEAFRGGQRITTGVLRMSLGRGLRDLEGREQLDVQGEGQARVEEPVRRGVHGVLVIAELRQTALDERVQLGQGLLTIAGPRELIRARRPHGLHARRLDLGPELRVVMSDVPRLRRRRRAFPRLPVLLVIVPFAAGRRAVLVHQQAGADPHLPIIRLHQPALGIFLEMGRHAAAPVEEVLGADASRDQPAAGREGAQILVEAVFVGFLKFEAGRLRLHEGLLEVLGEAMPVVLVA